MRNSKKKIALIIPAYNEAKVIGGVIRELRATFKKSPYSFQIIVVDDGSKDDTALQARLSGAYVIEHILNTGSGGATATGLVYAYKNGFDLATTSDADGQHDSEDVLRGVQAIDDTSADLLIGSRLMDKHGMPRIKTLGNWGLSLITGAVFGIRVTDSQSGLRVFSKRAIAELRWKTNGYEFCSEMLWRAKQAGLAINEFPAKAIYTEYSKSKGQNNWNAINIIRMLVKRRIIELFE